MRQTVQDRSWLAALLALSLLCFVPGFFSLPIVDRDEARFVQTSAQMLDSGDLVDLRLGDDARYNKPVGIYWMQAGMAALIGAPEAVQSYRAVSLVGALGAVFMTYLIGRLVLARPTAFAAAALMGATLVLGAEARIGKTDAMLLFLILLPQYVLLRGALDDGRAGRIGPGGIAAFWGGMALAVLVKGPIVFLVVLPLLAFLCLRARSLAPLWRLRPGPGLVVFLALVLPWYVAITLRSGGEFWQASLMRDFLGKLHEEQESHGAPFGTYTLLFWVTFWPGSMVFAAALPTIWRARRALWVQLAAAWVLPMWFAFEIASTKLPHYTMPAYPALAITAVWALERARQDERMPRAALWVSAAVGGVGILVLGAFLFSAQHLRSEVGVYFWLGALGVVVAVPLVWLMLSRQAWHGLGLAALATSLAMATALYPSLARMERVWPSVALADQARAHPDCTLWVAGYREASLLFLTRREVSFDSAADIAERIGQGGCILAAITGDELPEFTALQPDLVAYDELDLFNFGNGRDIRFHLFLSPAEGG